MGQIENQPFRLSNTFFAYVKIERAPSAPDGMDMHAEIGARMITSRLPELLEVQLRLETSDERPLSMQVMLIGLFTRIEDTPEPDSAAILAFVNNRALPVLWAYIDQMIVQVTAQMGIAPVRLAYPEDLAIPAQRKRRAPRQPKVVLAVKEKTGSSA